MLPSRFLVVALVALIPALAMAGVRGLVRNREGASSPIVLRLLESAPALDQQCTGALPGVTVTRSSSAYCTRSDGRLLLLEANTPRMESAGLLVEPTATNLLVRSQELDNASWSKVGVTVTANTDAAPDGTTTMDTVDDTSGVADGYVHQTAATTTLGQYTCSVFLKAGTQNAARIFFAGTGNTAGNTSCAINGISSTTTRYTCTSGSYGAGLTNVRCEFVVGANAAATGTLKFWGLQLETGAIATSPIPTAGTTAQRQGEAATYAAPFTPGARPCFAATITPRILSGATQLYWLQVYNSALDRWNLKAREAALETEYFNGSAFSASHITPLNNGTSYDVSLSYDGTNMRACVAGSCTNTPRSFTPSSAFSEVHIGHSSGSAQFGGHIRNIRIGKTLGACQ